MAYKILVLWTDYQKEAKNNAGERMLLMPNDLALQIFWLLRRQCYDIIKARLITSTIKEFYSPLEFLMS